MNGIWTVLLLVCSNVFMTFAWYGQIKLAQMNIGRDWPLILIILMSWGMAFFEYCFMVPANRIGSKVNGGPFSLMQLKVIQEAVSLIVFSVICVFVFRTETLHWNHFISFLCLVAAVFFCFLK